MFRAANGSRPAFTVLMGFPPVAVSTTCVSGWDQEATLTIRPTQIDPRLSVCQSRYSLALPVEKKKRTTIARSGVAPVMQSLPFCKYCEKLEFQIASTPLTIEHSNLTKASKGNDMSHVC